MYAVELDLTGRPVLVVGGGLSAAREVARCVTAGAEVTVVADQVCEDLRDLIAAGVVWVPRGWRAADLGTAWLVHACTGDPGQDAEIAAAAAARRLWCVVHPEGVAGATRWRSGARPGTGSVAGSEVRPGRVTLVGGGPGDPELITAKGLRLVRDADVVVTDRLGPTGLLRGLDPDVEIIDVGKSPDHHPIPQDEINRLLVEHALAGRRVVRLKGGDGYVFGRGGEEVAACREAGVEVDVVPGVSSAFAVPAAAGIPVTHRGLSRSVTVITGHDELGEDGSAALARLVRLGGTVVVLMGVARLAALVAGMLAEHLPGATPVAVVERGCTPEQRTVTARLDDIVRVAGRHEVRPPAVIVIGAVAGLAADQDRIRGTG